MLPYGSWPTPITSELVVRAKRTPGGVALDGGEVWWVEARPEEGGRNVILRRRGATTDVVLPAPWNARTAVHEYGGGAWWVAGGVLWFTDWSTQRLHRLDVVQGGADRRSTHARTARRGGGCATPTATCRPTARPCCASRRSTRSAAARRSTRSCGWTPAAPSAPDVVVEGPDFVSDPRWRPDGAACCWLEWDHPDMPWDATPLGRRASTGYAPSSPAGDGAGVGRPAVDGRWTGHCGSSVIARASGACTGGRPTVAARRWSTSIGTSGSRSGSSASPATRSSTVAWSCSRTAAEGFDPAGRAATGWSDRRGRPAVHDDRGRQRRRGHAGPRRGVADGGAARRHGGRRRGRRGGRAVRRHGAARPSRSTRGGSRCPRRSTSRPVGRASLRASAERTQSGTPCCTRRPTRARSGRPGSARR